MKKINLITIVTLFTLGVGTTFVFSNHANTQPDRNLAISTNSDNAVLISQSNISDQQIFYQQKGIAIKGTDTVAYFTEGKAVKGDRKYSYQWGNTTWWFKSQQNRDLFAQNPEKYAPQYGGFCAWAVSQNYTAPIDPDAWKIVNGKLYLNYDKNIQNRWSKDIPGNIAKGNKNWSGLKAGLIK